MALSKSLSLARLGNTGVSSLIKSSSTIKNQLNTYNDTVQRIAFENNPSDDNLNTYLTYLDGRVSNLETTGSIADATKALDMRQTMTSAVAKNTSFQIQNQSIQVITGNATSQDKLDFIQSAYQRAVGIGDITLAQSLMSQGYSLSQQIQYDQQVAAQNAVTVNNANETAIKKGYSDALSAVQSGLTDVFTQLKNGGEANINSTLKTFTKEFGGIYKQLTGEDLPKGSELTMGSLTQAYFNLGYQYNLKAAAALAPYDASAAQTYTQAAQDMASGKATVSVPGIGSVNYTQASQWAASPNLYRVTTDVNGQSSVAENAVTHYTMVNGQVIPVSNGNAGTAYGDLNSKDPGTIKKINDTLKGLGITNLTGSGDNLKVQLTNQAIQKLHLDKTDLKSGDQLTLVPQANGGIQFTKNGKIFTLALDSRSLVGVSQTDLSGKQTFVGGQYGFNQGANTLIQKGTTQQMQQNALTVIKQQAEQAQAQRTQQMATIAGTGTTPAAQSVASATQSGPTMSRRADGGYNFTYNGQAVSAAKYAQVTNTPFRNLLSTMATNGDTGAKTVLGFVGNDFKYDTGKVASYTNAGTYNALTWGSGVPTDTGLAPASLLGNGSQLKF